jgi:DNA primase
MSQEEVLAIARRYLSNVQKAGPDNIATTCPFHQLGDRITRTLSMSLSRGVWFCFSCHERGNLQSFLKKCGASYSEIETKYQFLIEELEKTRPPPPDPLRTRVLSDNPLPESLLGAFDMCPISLIDDGFTEETLRTFDVGFDMQNMRITYPLRDLHGKLVGISGRTIYDDVQPRYKIYDREYPTWGVAERTREDAKRGGLLWNAHNVYPEIFFGRQPKVCLVEGFKACMWVVQAGFRNTVALIGSFLTWEHQWILERMGAEVYVFLDNNPAGWKGRDYIGKTLSKTLTVRVVEYNDDEIQQPDGMDETAVLQAIEGAQEYHCWSMDKKESTRWHSEKIETP